jgi:predicted negative regulator of RcsB-dependent stress response
VDLLSDDDQWEAFKAWIKQNGLALVAGVGIGVALLLGWRWWQERKETRAFAAGARYEKILSTFNNGDIDGAVKQIDELKREYSDSAYVAPADLAAARIFVARKEFDKAAAHLKIVMDGAADPLLRPVAKLRLGRVLIAQGKYDEAVTLLSGADLGAYQAVYAEVRGDALLAKGDKAGALREYEAASAARLKPDQSASGGNQDGADLLDLKLNDLRAERT